MRAFIGQFDRVSLAIAGSGIALGILWLAAVDLGVAFAGVVIVVAAISLIIHHRWIEIGVLMVAIGLTAQLGYGLLGTPVVPPFPEDGTIPTEAYAPGVATMLWVGGLLLAVVIGAWDMWEAQRRERLDERHRQRRRERIGDEG